MGQTLVEKIISQNVGHPVKAGGYRCGKCRFCSTSRRIRTSFGTF